MAPTTYEPTMTAICAACIVIGVVYVMYGYRCFKTIMFTTGFIFAAMLVYLICYGEELMPLSGNIVVALTAGFLFGLITMLVVYVGLFVMGFHFGCLMGTSLLLGGHLLAPYVDAIQAPPDSAWITFATIMGCGLIGACSALYFRKGKETREDKSRERKSGRG